MANDTTRNPWRLDTAASITTQPVRPAVVRWTSPGASAGDTVVIQDNPPAEKANLAYGGTALTPRTVMTLVATGANYDSGNQRFELEVVWSGLKLTTINSGVVEITLR